MRYLSFGDEHGGHALGKWPNGGAELLLVT